MKIVEENFPHMVIINYFVCHYPNNLPRKLFFENSGRQNCKKNSRTCDYYKLYPLKIHEPYNMYFAKVKNIKILVLHYNRL